MASMIQLPILNELLYTITDRDAAIKLEHMLSHIFIKPQIFATPTQRDNVIITADSDIKLQGQARSLLREKSSLTPGAALIRPGNELLFTGKFTLVLFMIC